MEQTIAQKVYGDRPREDDNHALRLRIADEMLKGKGVTVRRDHGPEGTTIFYTFADGSHFRAERGNWQTVYIQPKSRSNDNG